MAAPFPEILTIALRSLLDGTRDCSSGARTITEDPIEMEQARLPA